MQWVFLALLAAIVMPDPAPGPFHTKARSRNLSCEYATLEQLRTERPGLLNEPKPRGDFMDRDALLCQERALRHGLLAPRDEIVADHLSTLAPELVAAAIDSRPDLAHHTWLVQVHYPNTQLAAKLDFAAKNALMAEGRAVSDRVPLLSATDIHVITSLEPDRSYATACRRYVQTGAIGPDDAVLAIISRDPQETTLHAGLCANGQWSWLR